MEVAEKEREGKIRKEGNFKEGERERKEMERRR